MSHQTPHALHPAQLSLLNAQQTLPTVAQWAVSFAVLVTKWDTHVKTRRALGRLEGHTLDDIGLSRFAAQHEADKPFWQD